MEDQSQTRNMILAAVLSLAVIIVWTIMFPPVPAEAPPAPTASVAADGTPVVPGATGTATAPVIAADPEATRDVALARSERLPIVTAKLNGSISLTGGFMAGRPVQAPPSPCPMPTRSGAWKAAKP